MCNYQEQIHATPRNAGAYIGNVTFHMYYVNNTTHSWQQLRTLESFASPITAGSICSRRRNPCCGHWLIVGVGCCGVPSMALHSVKAMLEDISVHMPGHLRTLPGVCDVVFTPGGAGASVSQIAAWDEVGVLGAGTFWFASLLRLANQRPCCDTDFPKLPAARGPQVVLVAFRRPQARMVPHSATTRAWGPCQSDHASPWVHAPQFLARTA